MVGTTLVTITKWSTVQLNMKGPHIFNCPLHMQTPTIVCNFEYTEGYVNISY